MEKGYTGSERAVHRYLGRWHSPRTDEDAPHPRKHRPRKTAPPPGPFDECQAKQAVWLYMLTPEKLKDTEKEQLAFLKGVHPSLETVYELVQTFLDMVHNQNGEQLESWLDQIDKSHMPFDDAIAVRYGQSRQDHTLQQWRRRRACPPSEID